MSDFFREVDEELRRDQLNKAWDRFGPYVIGAAILIVVATGGYRFWQWYQLRTAGAAGEAYYNAIRGGDDAPQDMIAALSKISEGGSGYEMLARLRLASAQAEAGDTQAAVDAFDAIAADNGVDALLQDVARIRAGYLLVDTANLAQMKARVEEMTTDSAPLRHSAREILGMTAYRTGEFTEAAKWFDAIMGDPATPQDLRNRIELMQSLLTSRLAGSNAGEGSGQ